MPDIASYALEAATQRMRYAHVYAHGVEIQEEGYQAQPVKFAPAVDGISTNEAPVEFAPARERWGRPDGVAFSEDGQTPFTKVYPVAAREGSDGIVQQMDQFRLPAGAVQVRFEEV